MTAAGLLLAAGAGRRIGGPKALVDLGGTCLVERGVTTLREAGCDPVLVVLGAEAEAVRPFVDAEVVVAPGWTEGVGASLRAGLTAMDRLDVDVCAVTLVDQPFIGAEAVRRVAERGDGSSAVVATYSGRTGHPVLLPRAVWPGVVALAVGDVGARAWLRSHPGRVLRVACDDTGSPDDIDTAADLALARASY